MSEDRSVEEMAHEVLMRQAKARAERSGESIEEAIEAVLNTEAGAQLRELRDLPTTKRASKSGGQAWHGSRLRSGRKISAIILRSTQSTPRTAEEPNSAEPIPRRREEAERELDELRRELYALREPRESPQTVEETSDRVAEPRPAAREAQEGARRPWWRRMFRN